MPYNLLIGKPSFNRLGAVISTKHLKMKFPSLDVRVATMKVDQKVARKCYENSLQARRGTYSISTLSEDRDRDMDPMIMHGDRNPIPVRDIKEVDMGEGRKLRVDVVIIKAMEKRILEVLQRNLPTFTWSIIDITNIDLNFPCHHLSVDPREKTVAQRQR